MTIKVLIVNTSDIEGGAARAAFRLHESLLLKNINSQMLVMKKLSDVTSVLGPENKFKKGLARLRSILDYLPLKKYKNKTNHLFSSAWLPFSEVVEHINKIAPDIVHLHWIAGGMIRIEDLAKIKAPIIWSLHDMWPFTGGCHYAENCNAFQKNCGNCPVLKADKKNDLSSKVFHRKQKTYNKKENITIIGLSNWLAQQAISSSLFSQYQIINIPNPIDTKTFSAFDKTKAREIFNLPLNKNIILFSAIGAASDPRKGFNQLIEALNKIQNKNSELVIFGSNAPIENYILNKKTYYLGHLNTDEELRVLYSAADVMIVPSLQENLSNTIMESLACGIPVVSFNIGGNSDLISHKVNGYLATPYDTTDLAKGIDWILNASNYQQLSTAAREKVLSTFDSNLVADRYITLYKNILGK